MCLPDLRRGGAKGCTCLPDMLITGCINNLCTPGLNKSNVKDSGGVPEGRQESFNGHTCTCSPQTLGRGSAGVEDNTAEEFISKCVYKFDLKQLHRENSQNEQIESENSDSEDDESKYKLNLLQNCKPCVSESSECRVRRPRRRSILRLRDGGAIKRINQFDFPLWAARSISVTTLLLVAMYYVYPGLRHFDPNSTGTVFLHLLCFTVHFGAQCWMTFVAGLVLFFNLPRVMFGQVQSRLFPMYFETTLVLSAITLVTFTIRHPYETWDESDVVQAGVLITCLVSTLLNAYLIAPAIVSNMLKIFEMEHAIGVGYAVGYVDKVELRRDPQYNSCYRRFRQVHGVSGLANIITMICNTVYLYYLACQCVYFNMG